MRSIRQRVGGESVAVVTLDGPAGAGKSTVARAVAERLGYAYMDTGAMYRAATWTALRDGVSLDDPEALARSTEAMDLRLVPTDEGLRVEVSGEDITEAIRSPEVTRAIRYLDGVPGVRAHLSKIQRAFGLAQPTAAEGRDMGTVVFPDAYCKVFLDASLDVRAVRRAAEMRAKGLDVDVATLRRDIEARDENDRNRATAPLVAAPDAHHIDTSALEVDEVVDAIVALARELRS